MQEIHQRTNNKHVIIFGDDAWDHAAAVKAAKQYHLRQLDLMLIELICEKDSIRVMIN